MADKCDAILPPLAVIPVVQVQAGLIHVGNVTFFIHHGDGNRIGKAVCLNLAAVDVSVQVKGVGKIVRGVGHIVEADFLVHQGKDIIGVFFGDGTGRDSDGIRRRLGFGGVVGRHVHRGVDRGCNG